MRIIIKLLIIVFCTSAFAQENLRINIDSTKVVLIGNKLYKAHQGRQYKNSGATNNTIIQYSEIDLSNVLFKTSTPELLPESYNALNALVILLRDNPKLNLKIDGHTDKVGHPIKNLKLSIKRARTIRLYLFKKGIKLSRLTANGYGDEMPICKSPCSENQRVEFTLLNNGLEQKLRIKIPEKNEMKTN